MNKVSRSSRVVKSNKSSSNLHLSPRAEKARVLIIDLVKVKTGVVINSDNSADMVISLAFKYLGIKGRQRIAKENYDKYILRMADIIGKYAPYVNTVKDGENKDKNVCSAKINDNKTRKTPLESDNDRAKKFYLSKQWLTSKARYTALRDSGGRCQCCGATREMGNRLVVDHIKPIRTHWDLRLDVKNMQVLCDNCNIGKGSWDETDFRK